MNITKKTYEDRCKETDMSTARKRHTMGPIPSGLAAQTSRPCPALKNKNYHSVNTLQVSRQRQRMQANDRYDTPSNSANNSLQKDIDRAA